MLCPNGFDIGADGCEICQCKGTQKDSWFWRFFSFTPTKLIAEDNEFMKLIVSVCALENVVPEGWIEIQGVQ